MSQYKLSLLEPNTLLPHRSGVAALALVLDFLNPRDIPAALKFTWKITEDEVLLNWGCTDKEAIDWLVKQSYKIVDGFLVCPALHLSEVQNKYTFSQGILSTFLQHSKQRSFEKGITPLAIPVEENKSEIILTYRKIIDCYYLRELKGVFSSKGKFKSQIPLKGHHFPGLVECFINGEYKESPEGFLALLFLPIACNYYLLKSGRYALIIPEVFNLLSWVKAHKQLGGSNYQNFRSPNASEAGLKLLLDKSLNSNLDFHQVNCCEVYQLGKQPWDRNQSGLKQAVYRIQASKEILQTYQTAKRLFSPKWREKESGESWLAMSDTLAWIAENLVAEREWYTGFFEFRKTNILYERKGIIDMTDEHLKPHEQVLLDAVKGSYARYLRGQFKFRKDKLNKQSLTQAEVIDVLESSANKVIYRLQRPATQQEFATALVDFLSKSISAAGKGNAAIIYNWIHGKEWRKARDLAMLAIATYQGKGNGETDDNSVDTNQTESTTTAAGYF